jgi:hypothetical protein
MPSSEGKSQQNIVIIHGFSWRVLACWPEELEANLCVKAPCDLVIQAGVNQEFAGTTLSRVVSKQIGVRETKETDKNEIVSMITGLKASSR